MKRFVLMALALCFLCSAAYAYDLNACQGNNDWNAIGGCIVSGAFGGDYIFFGIIMLGLLAIFMWQTNMPASAGIGVGLVVIVALGGMLGSYYPMLLNLAIIAIGAMLALALMHFVRR